MEFLAERSRKAAIKHTEQEIESKTQVEQMEPELKCKDEEKPNLSTLGIEAQFHTFDRLLA